MQWFPQVQKLLRIQMVLQSKQKIQPSTTWIKERGAMSSLIQVFELPRRPPSWFQPVSILET